MKILFVDVFDLFRVKRGKFLIAFDRSFNEKKLQKSKKLEIFGNEFRTV